MPLETLVSDLGFWLVCVLNPSPPSSSSQKMSVSLMGPALTKKRREGVGRGGGWTLPKKKSQSEESLG